MYWDNTENSEAFFQRIFLITKCVYKNGNNAMQRNKCLEEEKDKQKRIWDKKNQCTILIHSLSPPPPLLHLLCSKKSLRPSLLNHFITTINNIIYKRKNIYNMHFYLNYEYTLRIPCLTNCYKYTYKYSIKRPFLLLIPLR